MTKRTILLSLLLLLPTLSFGQRMFFKNYSTEEGLSSVTTQILQDEKGYLWISTTDGGIFNFDGESFNSFNAQHGLANNNVRSFLFDQAGYMWLGTMGGISRFDGKHFISYTSQEDSLINNQVHSVCELKDGRLLFGTEGGLIIREDDCFKNYSIQEGLCSNKIFSILEDSNNHIWIGTQSGLAKYEDGQFQCMNFPNKFGTINALYEDKGGNIWMGTHAGLYQYCDNQWTLASLPNTISPTANQKDIAIQSITEDTKNNLWFTTSGDGAIKYDQTEYTQLSIKQGLTNGYLLNAFEDREHNFWFATGGTGLNKFVPSMALLTNIDSQQPSNIVYALDTDDRGNIWIGRIQGGVSIFDGKEIKTYGQEDGLNHRTIRSIQKDHKGDMWIGTEVGLNVFQDGQFKDFSEKYDLRDNSVYAILEDSNCDLWFACSNDNQNNSKGGIRYLKNDTLYSFTIDEGLPSNKIYSIFEDSKAQIWIGTLQGISQYKDGQFINYDKTDGICGNKVIAIEEDQWGGLWFGTSNGLNYYNGESFKCFGNKYLTSSVIYLLKAQKNHLLIGTSNGLERLNLQNFYQNNIFQSIHYGKEEGFTPLECNQNAICIDSLDRVWMGTINGAVIYDAKEDKIKPIAPYSHITDIKLFNQSQNWKEYSEDLDSIYQLPTELVLPSSKNYLTFDFKGVQHRNPKGIDYQFMLDNLDEEWSPPIEKTSATYTNLSPNTYTFKVRSKNKNGIWTNPPASFTFTIKQPFWKRWYFIVAMCLLLGLFLFALYARRVNYIKDKAAFNSHIAELKLQAVRAQMNPHFIFNTLNSIQKHILIDDPEIAAEHLHKFSKLIRITLENSKHNSIPLNQEIERVKNYIALEQLRFKNNFHFDVQIDPALDLNETLIPPVLFQPYLENAIWHGLMHKKGERILSLKIKIVLNQLFCYITDNGIGREAAAQYQKHESHNESMGMKLSEDRLHLLNTLDPSKQYHVSVEDLYDSANKPQGTKVELILPLEINE